MYVDANATQTIKIPFDDVRLAFTEIEQVQIPFVFVCSVVIASVFSGHDGHKRQRVLLFQWFPKPRKLKIPFDYVYFVANGTKTIKIRFDYVRLAVIMVVHENVRIQTRCS